MALNKDTDGIRPALDELSANSLHRLSTQARKAAAIRAYNDALRIRDPRHDRPRGDALTLMYLNRHRIWQEGMGFSGNAESYLCGKRQVGGTRR